MLYSEAIRKGKPNGIQVVYRLWKLVENFYNKKQPADENGFFLWQQALLALNGENYFRTLVSDRVKAINSRDGHMAETIKNLLAFHGKHSRIVVWAHNGHTGDARYSSMSSGGYTSLAEILRKDLGRDKIFSVGFGTYSGTVLAGYVWNAALVVQKVLPAKEGTWEDVLHKLGPTNKIILSKETKNIAALNNWIEFRSIGAAYAGAAIYSRSIIPKRFDAFLFIDSTTAIRSVR